MTLFGIIFTFTIHHFEYASSLNSDTTTSYFEYSVYIIALAAVVVAGVYFE